MPQRTPACHLRTPDASEMRRKSPRTDGDLSTNHAFAPARGAAQEIANTASRHSGPRKWRKAVAWLVAAGLHPKANSTTLRVAEDLADRMDYSTGHVRYAMNDTAARLGMSVANLKKHVAYLRELGALVWVQHGCKRNINRIKGLFGYAGTATVYAAVIPAVYDHAMGHTIKGSGYDARIVIDHRGQVPAPRKPVDNPPVDNPSSTDCEPPSLWVVDEVGQVDMAGGFNYTPRQGAGSSKNRIPHQSTPINGRRRTATDVKKAIQETRMVRALVNWTQKVSLRELEFVLRPWTDRGWDGFRMAAELNGICSGARWRPSNPVAFIRARIAASQEQQQELEASVSFKDSTIGKEITAMTALLRVAQQTTQAPAEPERTDDDRRRARMDWSIWPEVMEHYRDDPDDAIDLYGRALCGYAINQDARLGARNDYAL